jgi:hypothetical protein
MTREGERLTRVDNRWDNVNRFRIGSCLFGIRTRSVCVAGQFVAPILRSVGVIRVQAMSSVGRKGVFWSVCPTAVPDKRAKGGVPGSGCVDHGAGSV